MVDLRLLPDSIRDESTEAMLQIVLEDIAGIDLTPLLVYHIDTVPASALPHLAEQFDVLGYRGWRLATSDADKRSLIKSAIELHRYKGTRYAIEKVLEVLGLQGDVEEWFQYGAAQGFFRITIDLNKEYSDETKAELIKLVSKYKNTRSHLDELLANMFVKTTTPYIGAAPIVTTKITVYPFN